MRAHFQLLLGGFRVLVCFCDCGSFTGVTRVVSFAAFVKSLSWDYIDLCAIGLHLRALATAALAVVAVSCSESCVAHIVRPRRHCCQYAVSYV